MHKLIANLARVTVFSGAILLAVTILVMPKIAKMQVHAGVMCGSYCGYQIGESCTIVGSCDSPCYCGVCNLANPVNQNLYCNP
jgi:hypothetical protein